MTKKIFLIVFIFIIIFSVYPNKSNAGDIKAGADNFLNVPSTNLISERTLQDVSSTIYTIFLGIAVVIAVAVAAILGIKFMTGSIEAQAKVKESLVPFVVGCVVVFGAFGIWRIVVSIGNSLIN